MRQLNPSTNLVLAVLCGLGLLGTLSMSWYAAAVPNPTTSDGPIEDAAFQVSQVFATSATGTVDGSTALGSARAGLVGLVVLVVLVVLAVGTPSLRHHAESLLRLVALAAPIVVLVAALAHPGVDDPGHIHYGFLVALVVTLAMSSAAWQGANMREKRKAPVRPRYGTAR